ncbi:MAG: response regulator [Lachnospiraceae bacterium]|jgi:two-component system response regulator YesN|nr:response regulator [Lachnospiraceae bacterium]
MNLLIVDDEYYSVESLKQKLDWAELGFGNVYGAYSLKQAQQYFHDGMIDVMLCDIEMPHGSGLELLAWVREKKYATACIFLTCHAKFDYATTAIKLGSTDYLLKPVNAEELSDAIRRAVQRLNQVSLLEEDSTPEEQEMAIPAVKKYIATHLAEDLDRDTIAGAVFLNPDYLSHLFREKTGTSLSAYILNLRMEKATRLLSQSTATIADIATSCGFSNISYFSRQFKASTGKTPHDFRKET